LRSETRKKEGCCVELRFSTSPSLDRGETAHIVPEEPRVPTHSKQLLLLISLVAVGLNPDGLEDGHGEGGGDESEVVVVEEGEGFGSGVDNSTSGESESEEEGREGCR